MNIKRLLKRLYQEYAYNSNHIRMFKDQLSFCKAIGDTRTADIYTERILELNEDNRRIMITIDEIEKRVS